MRLLVPGATGALGLPTLVWRRLRLLGMVGLVGVVASCSTPAKSGQGADVPETPRSRYIRQVKSLLYWKWKQYRAQRPNDVAFGSLQVLINVNPQGKVEHMHVKNDLATDPVLTRFTVQAIKDVELPPMPEDVISSLTARDRGCLEINYFVYNAPPPEGGECNVLKEVQPVDRKLSNSPPKNGGSGGRGKETTVKLTSTPLERYYRRVTGQVEKKWHIYRLLRPDGVTCGSLQLVFYVNKTGKVENLHVLDDRKSNKVLTAFTLQAIKDAEIPPMPADVIPLLPKNDPERLKIEYNVLIY